MRRVRASVRRGEVSPSLGLRVVRAKVTLADPVIRVFRGPGVSLTLVLERSIFGSRPLSQSSSSRDESGQDGGVPALADALWLLPLTGELTARWSPAMEPATLSCDYGAGQSLVGRSSAGKGAILLPLFSGPQCRVLSAFVGVCGCADRCGCDIMKAMKNKGRRRLLAPCSGQREGSSPGLPDTTSRADGLFVVLPALRLIFPSQLSAFGVQEGEWNSSDFKLLSDRLRGS